MTACEHVAQERFCAAAAVNGTAVSFDREIPNFDCIAKTPVAEVGPCRALSVGQHCLLRQAN